MKTLRQMAVIGSLLCCATARAQTYYYGDSATSSSPLFYGSVSYQLGIPIGNTFNYVSDVEWRGIGVDLDWLVKPSISIGLAFGWNVFYQNTTTTINFVPSSTGPNGLPLKGGIAIYGNQDRSFNFFPLLADFRYLHRLKNGVRPFLGVGVGAYITTQYLGIGFYSFQRTDWQFGVAPELGVLIPIEGGAAIQLSARYNMGFPSGGIPFQQWLGLSLGVAWGPGL
jgi:hypothetical protein